MTSARPKLEDRQLAPLLTIPGDMTGDAEAFERCSVCHANGNYAACHLAVPLLAMQARLVCSDWPVKVGRIPDLEERCACGIDDVITCDHDRCMRARALQGLER